MSKKPENKSKTLTVKETPGKSRDVMLAELATNGVFNNAMLVTHYAESTLGEMSLMDCIDALRLRVDATHNGSLREVETVLASQAHALDSIFASLALRAKLNMGEYMEAAEKYMRLALKAQSQCRATLETLAEVKNPKPHIQNNKAMYQQVNNEGDTGGKHDDVASGTRTEEKVKSTNELLEDDTNAEDRMDTRATQAAGRDDTELETVGAQYRPKDKRRQGG